MSHMMVFNQKRRTLFYIILCITAAAFIGSRMASNIFLFGILRELTGFFWGTFLILAIIGVALTCRKAAGFSMMLAGLSFGSLMTSYPNVIPVPDAHPDDIVRLYQHNTYYKSENYEETAEMMASGAYESDIVFFQEVRPELFDVAEQLAGGRFSHRVMNKGEHYPVALFSRFKIMDHTFRRFDNGGRTFIDADIALPSGKMIRFIGAHLASPGKPQNFHMRELQLKELGALLDQADPNIPLILAGDLNTTMFNPTMRALAATYNFSHARASGDSAGTWPMILPEPFRITIDHAFGMNGALHAERRIMKRAGSDHLPVHHVFHVFYEAKK